MRVLIVSQYFWPESFRINELAQSLVARGLDVDVLTGKPNYPEGAIYPGYRAAGFMHESWQGAKIFRVPLFPRGFRSGVRLFLNYLSFMFSGAILGAWQLRDTNSKVIFVYAPSPLLQALPALFIGWLKRIPVIVYVQDLWPESLAATGYIRNPLAIRMVEKLVKLIYRRSDLIMVSSRPFVDSILRFSPSAEIVYYPNSVDVSFCDPDSGLKPDVPALDEGFCVVFAGNVGAAQAVHVISEAAERLRDHGDIRLVVLGAGSELEWMRARIVELGLDNLCLAGRFPVEAMPNLLSRADVLLVTLADQQIFAATVPNKIQAYMAVGRPIIASMNGEGARLVQEADAGISVPAEDGVALAGAILRLYSMPAVERDRLGENGRRYYQKHFDHEQLVDELIGYFEQAVSRHKGFKQ
jgi:glycosyltransferase involved in cell wall biosynthesis